MIQAFGDKLIVEEIPPKQGKIHLSVKEWSTRAKVLSVGNKVEDVHIGDTIVFQPYSLKPIQGLYDSKLFSIAESEVLLVEDPE